MGVPLFFGWLRRRYPSIVHTVVDVLAEDGEHCAGAAQVQYMACACCSTGADTRAHWCAVGFPHHASCPAQGFACDYLYLDMNGIIHQCTHPVDRPHPSSEEAMFREISRYIDRLVALARPRKLVYMAIDGVAPRAKMNQQRARRFRAAMDADAAAATSVQTNREKEREEREERAKWAAMGAPPPPFPSPWPRLWACFRHDQPWPLTGIGGVSGTKPKPFDTNVITPGTKFMARCAAHLRRYCAARTAGEPGLPASVRRRTLSALSPWRGDIGMMPPDRCRRRWLAHWLRGRGPWWVEQVAEHWSGGLQAVLSDASVPGEGEHKIMAFIRGARQAADFDPNSTHTIYGLDADLVLLALVTHEPHFHVRS
jgi:5'-3' exoribonuclease 2